MTDLSALFHISHSTDSCPLLDMHSHTFSRTDFSICHKELLYRSEKHILTCFSSGTPEEYAFLNDLLRSFQSYDRYFTDEDGINSQKTKKDGSDCPPFLRSFGIHPWYSDQFSPQNCDELYRDCEIIGEIGLDSLWCDVPLKIQRRVFEKQLDIAAQLHKAVILHTKDCEAEIADMIRHFPEKICVHWYSGDPEILRKYIDMDCYFTFGPDTGICDSPTIRTMLKDIPSDRIFTETDGLSSIYWLLDNLHPDESHEPQPQAEDYSLLDNYLNSTLQKLSPAKGLSGDKMKQQIIQNLQDFLAY